MGMSDETWCMSCGKSQPYEDSDVTCGECERSLTIDFIESFLRHLIDKKNELEEELSANSPLFDAPAYHYLEGKVETISDILLELEDRYRNA